ncbi:hypothetical protein [Desulfocicer vacuolatum]|uniref:hypothetical protein n=1 Tax=Desulfocicer vacuolatum TaxID=2298 RepID=UPI001BAF10C9|nr:hypothetical protein [Desulfocicer vacuolatum]
MKYSENQRRISSFVVGRTGSACPWRLYEKAGAGYWVLGSGCSQPLFFHCLLWLVVTAMYVLYEKAASKAS